MTLKENIDKQIKEAMLSKNADRLKALRGIKQLIVLAETEKGKSGELNSEKEIAVLQKAAKQRKESADIFAQNGRQSLADAELSELAVIEEFLPKKMSIEDITSTLQQIITDGNYSTIKDMGTVMKAFNTQYPGQDGKEISNIIKSILI